MAEIEDEGREESDQSRNVALDLSCEVCKHEFAYQISVPFAVVCPDCNSTFDARLQLVKGYKREWDTNVSEKEHTA